MCEQGLGSLMFELDCWRHWAESDPHIFTVNTCMGAFEHDMVKPTRLFTNMKSASILQRDYTKAKRSVKRRRSNSEADEPGGKSRRYLRQTPAGVAGARDLHKSAEYTTAFVNAVLCAWERERGRPM